MDRDKTRGGQPAPPGADALAAEAGATRPGFIPDHELVRRIGRGSYGEVWLARNMMGVYRAVKIVYRRAFSDRRPFERELSGIRKFEPLSRSHEGFIDVLHVGINEEQGYFYYVMELGDDRVSAQEIDPEHYSPKTLAREISTHGKLGLQECLQLGLALSLALAELHKHGLVHRDVKPSNIIFVNGVAKLADIGLVAEVDEARSYVGTEGFIPPEGPGAPPADVYSLGKVLYEASTGKDRQEFPDLPTAFDCYQDHAGFLELNEVILQACQNEVAKRYRSAWEMHADLLVLANGKSVKRLRMLERRLAHLKRGAGISVLVILAAGAVFYQIYRGWRDSIEARQRQVGASVAYGNRDLEAGNLMGALPYFVEALRLEHGERDRELQDRLRIGSTLSQCAKLEQFWFLGGMLNQAMFSPDGKRVLITRRFGRPYQFDAITGRRVPLKIQAPELYGASYSPDGSLIATAGNTNHIASIWKASDGRLLLQLHHPDFVTCVRFSPDGSRLVTGCNDGKARVWNVHTGKLELTLAGHKAQVQFAGFSHDGRLIVTGSRDDTARIWNATTGRQVGPPLEHGSWVSYADFSPDDTQLVTACYDYRARVWDVASGKELQPEMRHRDLVESAEFSPDGRMILTSCLDGTARLWRADTRQPLGSNPILNHESRVTQATFGPEGRRILTICAEGTARIWDLAGVQEPPTSKPYVPCENGQRYLTLTSNTVAVHDTGSGDLVGPRITARPALVWADLNDTGQFVATLSAQSAGSNETDFVEVWNAGTGKAVAPMLCISNYLINAIVSDDGRRLVTFNLRGVRLWTVRSGQPFFSSVMKDEPVSLACFSRSGNRLATCGGKQVRMWDAATGRLLFQLPTQPEDVDWMEFSPDGSRLVVCRSDPQLNRCAARVWDVTTDQPVGAPLQHKDGVLFADFSPDGRRVVTSSEDYTAIEWDAASGRQLVPALRHLGQVRVVRFSPNGRWIATASRDKTARVWSAETGDPLTPPLQNLTKLTNVVFLPDSRGIITSDDDGNSRLWKLNVDERPLGDLLAFAQLLSGDTAESTRQTPQLQPRSLRQLWQRLRDKYPSSFDTSPREVAAWHELQAEQCEADHQWFGAVFHLRWLQKLHPHDQSLAGRIARLEARPKDHSE